MMRIRPDPDPHHWFQIPALIIRADIQNPDSDPLTHFFGQPRPPTTIDLSNVLKFKLSIFSSIYPQVSSPYNR